MPATLETPVPVDFLRDESQRAGTASAIVFPADTEEVAAVLRQAAASGQKVTVQGARTGIAAGAVPDGGVILSTQRMNRILDGGLDAAGRPWLRVQPGLRLADLRAWLAAPPPDAAFLGSRPRRWMFAPDPTESGASLGGMVACNASGACSFAYGATRRHLAALTLVLVDGDRLELRRGLERADGRRFALRTAGGRLLCGELPAVTMPAVKHAAGYWVRPDMELIDLVIGSEGTLGVVTEIELLLQPAPTVVWGALCFLPDETDALDLASLRPGGTALTAVEYFDAASLALLRAAALAAPAAFPMPPAAGGCALYLELAGADEAVVLAAATDLAARLPAARGDAAQTWLACGAVDLARLKAFRHAVPEGINRLIAARKRQMPELVKVGTDLAVPALQVREMMARYRRDLAASGLEAVIFGHLGDHHLHVNILPRSPRELAEGRCLAADWARQAVAWGGTVSAEHGIGKLKTALLEIQYGAAGIAAMRQLRRLFDPQAALNGGTLFADS